MFQFVTCLANCHCYYRISLLFINALFSSSSPSTSPTDTIRPVPCPVFKFHGVYPRPGVYERRWAGFYRRFGVKVSNVHALRLISETRIRVRRFPLSCFFSLWPLPPLKLRPHGGIKMDILLLIIISSIIITESDCRRPRIVIN